MWVSLEGLAWRTELSVWTSRLMMDAPPGVPGLARDIISISDSALSDFWRREFCICILQQASRC